MGWLDARAEQLAKERQARNEAKTREDQLWQERCDARAQALAEWVAGHLTELAGRATEFGPLSLEQVGATVTIAGGVVRLATIRFGVKEEEEWNRDDMKMGTGRYFDTRELQVYTAWTSLDGKRNDPQAIAFSDNNVADYLLAILKAGEV